MIELNEMLDLINRFFRNTSTKTLTIGGIVGSHPLSHVMDIATGIVPFEQILILEGCSDFCYLPKRFISNYIPFSYVFSDVIVEHVQPETLFPINFYQQNLPYVKTVNEKLINHYEMIIINNAHLIDGELLQQLINTFPRKCVAIVDPYDIGGEQFMDVPGIVDCLEKQSPIIGMARNLWGINTRAIDKHARGSVSTGKVTRKGIGKLDGRMYVCDDHEFITTAQSQQQRQHLRKGQRFFITDDRSFTALDDANQLHVLTKNMMLIMYRANTTSPLPQQFRLYHARHIIRLEIAYDNMRHYPNEHDYHIKVKPANVLSIAESRYHRYVNTALVCTKEISTRELYSVMKNSINLTICKVKGM